MDRISDTPRGVLVVVAFGCVAFLYFLITTIISYRKLRHIKGPRLAALSQLWLFNVTAKGDVYLAAEHVLRKYGKLRTLRKGEFFG